MKEESTYRDFLLYSLFVEKVDNQWMVSNDLSETNPFPIWRTDALLPFDSLIFKDSEEKQAFLEDSNPWLEPVQSFVRFFAPYRVGCVVTVQDIFEMTPARYFVDPPVVGDKNWMSDLAATKFLAGAHSETHYPLIGFELDCATFQNLVLSEYGQSLMLWNAQVESAVHHIAAGVAQTTVKGERLECTLGDLYALKAELCIDLLAVPDDLNDPLYIFLWQYGPSNLEDKKSFEGMVYQLPILPDKVPNLNRSTVERILPVDVVAAQMN